jgi:hypothetical protein
VLEALEDRITPSSAIDPGGTALLPFAATVTEGTKVTASTRLFEFTDHGGNRVPASDFTAVVTWGDGSSDTVDSSDTGPAKIVFAGSGSDANGPFSIFDVIGGTTKEHTYDEVPEGSLFVVQATDTASGNTTGPISNPFFPSDHVSDAPLAARPTPPNLATAEGTVLSALAVASFTDGNPGATADNFPQENVTIHWGDGTTSPGQVSESGGVFTVRGAHAYAEESPVGSPYQVTVDVSDIGGSALIGLAGPRVTVAEPAITLGTGAALTGLVEGSATGTVTVATFAHAGGVDPADAFNATIDWGDGTPVTTHATVLRQADGTYAVQGSHTYTEEGFFAVRVQVTEEGAGTGLVQTDTAPVADPAVVITAGSNVATAEGTSTGTVVLATFTGPGGPEALTEFSATVNWGDGSAANNTTDNHPTISIAPVAGTDQFQVVGTHTFVDESPAAGFTITTTVHHHGEFAGQATVDTEVNTQTAVVSDPAVAVTGGFAFRATEGPLPAAAQTVATFTDPGGPELSHGQPAPGEYAATIDWGDGGPTSAGTITWDAAGHTFRVAGNHRYADDGGYTVTVTVSHGGSATPAVSSATVADAALTALAAANLPHVTAPGTAVGPITGIATFTDPAGVGAETTADFTATINWGDGGTDPGTVVSLGGGNYRVDAPSHTYTAQGPYAVGVTLRHDQLAAVTTPSQAITVAVVQDNFHRPDSPTLGPDWTNKVAAPKFAVHADQAVAVTTPASLATENISPAANVFVQADYTLSPVVAATAGLVARYNGTGDGLGSTYVGLVVFTGSAYFAQILAVHGGSWSALASQPMTRSVLSGTLGFEVFGSTLKLFLNGAPVIAAHDTSITAAGLVGMRGRAVAYGNFAAATLTAQTTTLPVQDSFNKPDNSELDRVWTEQAGAFTIRNQAAAPLAGGVGLATVNAPPAADVTVQATISLDPVAAATAGLVARYNGTGDGLGSMYLGRIVFAGGGYVAEIDRVRGGVITPRASVALAGFTGTGTLRFVVSVSSLKLYLNGNQLLSVTDTSITGPGLVGMRGRSASFDDFSA